MSRARRLNYSYDDYLRALEASHIKLEFCNGQIYAMAGGTPTHAQLGARVIRWLGAGLGTGPCEVYSSDLKIRVESSDLSTFPDASIVCGKRELSPVDSQAVTNPTILVEVTSRSTEDYDRGEKLRHYQQLPAVRAVLFVSHRSPTVTVVERTLTGWAQHDVEHGGEVVLHEPALRLSVDELYAGIEFEAR
jgi:Uma2 family endonuclease